MSEEQEESVNEERGMPSSVEGELPEDVDSAIADMDDVVMFDCW